MKLYVFASINFDNVFTGYENQMWAVSLAPGPMMQARRRRAKRIRKGDKGILYVGGRFQVFTVPFEFDTAPELWGPPVTGIWPEPWTMPFRIKALGPPDRFWHSYYAIESLPFVHRAQTRNLVSLFKMNPVSAFSPIEVGDEDWHMFLANLSAPMSKAS